MNASIDVPVMNEHVSTPINGNAAWLVQLSLPTAFTADTSHMRPIRISQNLDPVISVLSHNDVAVPVEGNAVRLVELAGARAFFADSPHTSTVGTSQNLQAMIQLISDNKISIIVYGDEPAEKSVCKSNKGQQLTSDTAAGQAHGRLYRKRAVP